MRFEYEGMSLWYGTADAPALEGDVQAGSDLMITIGVRPWNAGNRVVVLYRVNHGPTEQITARWMRNDARQQAQYFRAPFPSFRVGDTVEYLVVCRRAGRQLVPPPAQPERFASSFSVSGIGAKQEPGSIPQLQALATNPPGMILPFLRPINSGQGDEGSTENGGKAGTGSPGTSGKAGGSGQPPAPKPPSPVPPPIHTPTPLPIEAPPCPIPPFGSKGNPCEKVNMPTGDLCEGVRIQIRDLLFDLQRTAGNVPVSKPEGVQEARQRRANEWYKVHGKQLADLEASLEGCHNLDCQGPPIFSFELAECLEKALPPDVDANTVRGSISDTIQNLLLPLQANLQKQFPTLPPLFIQPVAESWCLNTDGNNCRERGNVWHSTAADAYLPVDQVGLQRVDHFIPSEGTGLFAFRVSYPALKKLVEQIWLDFPKIWRLDAAGTPHADSQGPLKLEELSLSFPQSSPDTATTVLRIKGSYEDAPFGSFTLTSTDTLRRADARDPNNPVRIDVTPNIQVDAIDIITRYVMGIFPIIPLPYQIMAYTMLFGQVSGGSSLSTIGSLIANVFQAPNPLLLPRRADGSASKIVFVFDNLANIDDSKKNAGIIVSGYPKTLPRAPSVWITGPTNIPVDSTMQSSGAVDRQYALVPIDLRRDGKTGLFPSVQWQVDGKDIPGATEESVTISFDIRRLKNVLPPVLTKTVSVRVQDADKFNVSSKDSGHDLLVQIELVADQEGDRQGPHGKRLPPP